MKFGKLTRRVVAGVAAVGAVFAIALTAGTGVYYHSAPSADGTGVYYHSAPSADGTGVYYHAALTGVYYHT